MSQLPPGWTTSLLGDLATECLQHAPEQNEWFWYIDIASIDRESKRILSPQRLRGEEAPSRARKVVRAGDVLVSMTRPNLNAVALVSGELDGQVASTAFDVLRPILLDPRWLFYAVRSSAFIQAMSGQVQGALYPAVRSKDVRGYLTPVAPVAEQKRIADKLDDVLGRLDTCRASLDRALTLISRFRRSVLVRAVEGDLASEWRELHAAPEWTYARAADICDRVQSGGTPKAGFVVSPGVPFLKVYNIVDQRVAFEVRPQYITEAVHRGPLAKSQAKPGDVLMNIVGPPLGKVAIVPATFGEWNINQAITLFRPSDRITTDWLYIVLSSGLLVDSVAHETKGSAGQVNISLSQCRDFIVPVPSVEEQLEISRRVTDLVRSSDHVETQVRMAIAQLGAISGSVITKAFRGELVPQDPGDEAAGELLMRIRNIPDGPGVAGRSTRAARRDPRRRTKGETSMVTRKDVTRTHLTTILEERGALTAEALWAASQLEIDEFYDQLKDEESRGLLRERRDAGHAPRLLEATL